MPYNTKCEWCGAEVPPGRYKCDDCKDKSKLYRWTVKNIRRSWSLTELCSFRNMLLDMKYNMPNAKHLPYDLDYQLDRVTRYISEK